MSSFPLIPLKQQHIGLPIATMCADNVTPGPAAVGAVVFVKESSVFVLLFRHSISSCAGRSGDMFNTGSRANRLMITSASSESRCWRAWPRGSAAWGSRCWRAWPRASAASGSGCWEGTPPMTPWTLPGHLVSVSTEVDPCRSERVSRSSCVSH